MATITGLTADRMLAIEAASVVDGDIVGDNLILTKHDGSTVNAGNVRGPQGVPGPVSSDLAVGTALPILDVGQPGQIRAGRQLAATDFTKMGLAAPAGLWNLGDLTDASGNGRALLNKGAVPVSVGITGLNATCVRFSGLNSQALYIPDTGAADPFRIKSGSFGCWVKTAKRGIEQVALSKWNSTGNQRAWILEITASNVAAGIISFDGAGLYVVSGISDIADDRWHFVVVTYDGALTRLYVDGIREGIINSPSAPLFNSNAPFNIGSASADAATAAGVPHYGRIDEAFVTSDLLTDDQVRNLYCARITHALGTVPTRTTLSVRRRRRGAAFTTPDFFITPTRLYNFSAGSMGDEGSANVTLTNNGNAANVAGADGSSGNAMNFNGGQSLSSNHTAIYSANNTIILNSGGDQIIGPSIMDGAWHFVVAAENNFVSDTVQRRFYVDGRLVGSSTVMNSITLAGANRFRIGAQTDGTSPFVGQIDGVFVIPMALTAEDVQKLFLKGTQALAPSPKNAGDHVEALSSTDILATFDTIDTCSQIDLGVAA
jgi:hypothetical protein